jgi:transcriptional regulator with XRE-family HTH domain
MNRAKSNNESTGIIAADLGRRIRDARKSHRMTQGKLAAHLGVSQGLVSRWEKGEQMPQPQAIAQLAALAGAPVGEFHYGPGAASSRDAGTALTGTSTQSPLPGTKVKRVTDIIDAAIEVAKATGKRDVAIALSVILEKCVTDDTKYKSLRRESDASGKS